MRALLLATGEDVGKTVFMGIAPLRPILDVPLLQLTLERLVYAGIREFEVVACSQAERVEELLGDGTRWGVRIRVHLVRNHHHPLSVLSRLDLGPDDQAWIVGHADRLPRTDFTALPVPCTLQTRHDQESEWTGWATVTSALLRGLPAEADERETTTCFEQARVPHHVVEACADTRNAAALVQSNMDALRRGEGATARMRTKGIWVGRGAVIHETARLAAPVYIGSEVIISAGAVVGPWTVVGSECVVDTGAHVERSVVRGGTYVGRDLEVREAIVSKRSLHPVALDTAVFVPESHILGDLHATQWRDGLQGLVSRMVGSLLTVILLPAILWSRRATAGSARPCWALPRTYLWHSLLTALPRVARGEIRLVGLPERSPSALEELPQEWRDLCSSCPVGVVTPSQALAEDEPHAEVCFTHEAWYAAHRSWRTDLSLFARWMVRVARDHGRDRRTTSLTGFNEARCAPCRPHARAL